MNKQKLLGAIADYSQVLIGSAILALAYACFVAPYKIVPGGVYGISIVLHYVTGGIFESLPDGLPIGTTSLVFNIPLMILATKYLGLGSGKKTITAFIAISVFTDFFTYICNGKPLVESDILLSCFYGGALMGVGVAMIFNGGGTCAGTDVIAQLISKKTHVKVNKAITIIDSIIVILGLIAFGDLSIPLYSWLVIFIYGAAVGILHKETQFKSVFIVTSKPEEVRQVVIGADLKIGGNYLHAQSLSTMEEKEIVFAMVRRGKIAKLKKEVEKVDKNVFFIVMDLTRESYYYSQRGW